jgi:hypothetical protein
VNHLLPDVMDDETGLSGKQRVQSNHSDASTLSLSSLHPHNVTQYLSNVDNTHTTNE